MNDRGIFYTIFILAFYHSPTRFRRMCGNGWPRWRVPQNLLCMDVLINYTVYPKKYAHGFCFAVLCCGYTLTGFCISIRLTSLALWQSNDCPSANKATLMNMDKYFMWIHYERLHKHNKAKHNKTVCIILGICCRCSMSIVYGIDRVVHFCLVFCQTLAHISGTVLPKWRHALSFHIWSLVLQIFFWWSHHLELIAGILDNCVLAVLRLCMISITEVHYIFFS